MRTSLFLCLLGPLVVVFGNNAERANAQQSDYVRVEVEIVRLENSGSIKSNNGYCDLPSSCDPVVNAYLDVNTPTAAWPDSSGWPLIFEATNTDSPAIGKKLTKNLCGAQLSTPRNINLRVHVTDADPGGVSDEIGKFDCIFELGLQGVASSNLHAAWGPEVECHHPTQQGKIRLITRAKAYRIDAAVCYADGGSHSGSASGSENPNDFPSARVEVEIVRLENSGSIQANGGYCHFTSSCYPEVSAFLDVNFPADKWPQDSPKSWPTIFRGSNVNSPTIEKKLGRSICSTNFNVPRSINLRVHIRDSSSGYDISDFKCLSSVGSHNIVADEASAHWGPETECSSVTQPGKIKLFVRQKAYRVAWATCQATVAADALLWGTTASAADAAANAQGGSWNPLRVVNAVVGAGSGGVVGAGVGAVSGGLSGAVMGGKSGAEQGAAYAGEALGSVGESLFGSFGKTVFGTIGKLGGGAVGGGLGIAGGVIGGTAVGGVKGAFTGTGEGAKAGKDSFNPFAGTMAGAASGMQTGLGAGKGVDKVITGSDTNVPKITKRHAGLEQAWIKRGSLSGSA